jgi:NAD(P)-dependent dehydrogenase (short-subunit alcohol dehydrogenase family)
VRVKLMAATLRVLRDDQTFLLSATRLGGRHGYDAEGATSVLGGAVTGFTKALAQERPKTLVKAVDFEPDAIDQTIADTLISEAILDPGAVEIGYADGLRWSVGLLDAPARQDPERPLTAETTFLVTGAAGSIVHEVAVDLCQAIHGGSFHLLDLVPAPDPADPDLERYLSDRDALKRTLAERIRERGERPTPKLVERELARLERTRCALDTIKAIERVGGTTHWHQVDLTDADAVGRAVADALAVTPRIDVVLHCAGLDISHDLPDKPQREYDLVFDVKAHGWLNLLAAMNSQMPDTLVAFGSIAGRFGNRGQTDYAAANDLLCKTASQLRRSGRAHAIAIDWTAWASVGMASRGSIPKVMEMAGIDMLPPEIGAPVVRRELLSAGPSGEVVVAGSLGILLEDRHATGGLDSERATTALHKRGGPMLGRVRAFSAGGVLTVSTELEPRRQAFLDDHRIGGTPVLPGVMGMEAFAELARAFAPGFEVVELADIDLLAPFKFYRDEPRTLTLQASIRDGGQGTLAVACELIGRRVLPGKGEQETRHFTGSVRLARTAAPAPRVQPPPAADSEERGVGHDDVYRVYFHGPAYQVLDRAWRENGNVVGRYASGLPTDHEPAEQPTEIAPRLIELCFQTAGIWELAATGRMALPTHVDRMVRYAEGVAPERLWAIVSPRTGGIDADVVDETGTVHLRLEGYRTIELAEPLEPGALGLIRSAMGG